MRRVQRFYVEDTEFTDLNQGIAVWDDGQEQYVIDVLKDPDEITPKQYHFLVQELLKHMVGLTSIEQISYLYHGVLYMVLDTDIAESQPGQETIRAIQTWNMETES